MFTYILVIIISGKEVTSNCELSMCFNTFEKCYQYEQRINNGLRSDITAKCVNTKDYYEKKVTV
jgi:hypothetical protein